MSLWNVRDLPAPPVNTAKYALKGIDADRLRKTITEACDFYKSCNHLYTEAVLLSTFAYRMKSKFRMNKDFKQLEKVNKALRVYFKMNISKILKDFYHLHLSYEEQIAYLPTRDMLDYVLVRVQGLAKLLVRIVETSKIAAELVQLKLQIGHFWQQNILVYCMVSRIYVITRHIVKYTCSLYDRLIPFRQNLVNNNKNNFLPENYTLPKDLRLWLDVPWIDEDIQYIEIEESEPLNIPFFNLADSDDEVEFCDEYIDLDNEKMSFSNLFTRMKKNLNSSSLRDFNEEVINLDDDVLDLNSEIENVDSDSVIEVIPLVNEGKEMLNEKNTTNEFLNDDDFGEEIIAEVNTSVKKKRNKKIKILNSIKSDTTLTITSSNEKIPESPIKTPCLTQKQKKKKKKANKKNQEEMSQNNTPITTKKKRNKKKKINKPNQSTSHISQDTTLNLNQSIQSINTPTKNQETVEPMKVDTTKKKLNKKKKKNKQNLNTSYISQDTTLNLNQSIHSINTPTKNQETIEPMEVNTTKKKLNKKKKKNKQNLNTSHISQDTTLNLNQSIQSINTATKYQETVEPMEVDQSPPKKHNLRRKRPLQSLSLDKTLPRPKKTKMQIIEQMVTGPINPTKKRPNFKTSKKLEGQKRKNRKKF